MSLDADVVVIGGGVVGLALARRLAGDGAQVALLERNACGAEASWAGAGILSPCNPHRADPLFHLTERSLALFPGFCDALREETGIDPEYQPCGELQLVFTPDSLGIARSDARAAAGRVMPDGGPIYELHDGDAARALEPAVAGNILGALECRQSSHVRNPRLLRALRESCLRRGVRIRENQPATGIETDEERLTAVRSGEARYPCGRAVLCAGAWSSLLDSRLSLLMPVHPVRGQMVLMKADVPPIGRIIARGKTYLVPRRDGHILLGSTEEPEAEYVKRNTPAGVAYLLRRAMELVPALADAPVLATWAGLRPGSPDDKPYIGPIPGIDGLYAATGHFRAGLTLSPVTAEAVVALLAGRVYDIDLSAFAPGRAMKTA